jgi:CubicO group peptidase (beta-lactamase class C family)
MKPLLKTLHNLIRVVLAFSIILLTASAASRADTPDFATIEAYVEEQMRANQIPGLALGIVQGDQIVHLRGFGVADPSGQPVTPQTPFIIGSLSKSFTALAVMQLVEEGKVELDAPAQAYIPWFRVADPDASARITVRHLLNQTSGISGNEDRLLLVGTGAETVEQHVREMSHLPLAQPVGTTLQYSSWNYLVLGLLVETVSGQSYEDYVRQYIFAPLEMQNSFASEAEAMQHGLATGYRWWFGFPLPARTPYRSDLLPAGFLISSVEDMAHFLIANINGGRYGNIPLLSPEGVAEMHRPAIRDAEGRGYGMGWGIETINGVPAIMHEGLTENFFASMIIEPQGRWGIVVLTNASNLYAPKMASRIAANVLSLLLGRQPTEAGPSFWRFYLIVDAVVLLLTAVLAWSVVKLPRWRKRLTERRPRGLLRWLWRVVLPIAGDFVLPFILLVFIPSGAGFPFWSAMTLWQPDLAYWALAIAVVMLAKGVVRAGLAFSAVQK